MLTALIFIAVLAVLVLSHEFGHFIVARGGGVKVEEFGFGFPPRIFGVRRLAGGNWRVIWGNRRIQSEAEHSQGAGGTVYSVNWLPLGGFVKIKGEDALASGASDADSFQSRSFWRRAAILVAGVAMNVIVAALLLSIGFMIGLPQIADGDSREKLRDIQVEAIQVLPGKPAEAAGVKPGDVIIKIDDIESPTLVQLREYVDLHRDDVIAVTIRRGGEIITKTIHPIVYPDTNKGGLGIAIAEVGIIRYPWYQAIYHGLAATGFYLKEIVLGFFFLIRGLFTGAGAGAVVAGPVGVAVLTGAAARMGLAYLIQFTALLSLNLAVLNILPIPALDGGRLLFIVIGKIIGRPVSPKYEHLFHTIGFVLLIALVLWISARDVGALRHATSGLFQ